MRLEHHLVGGYVRYISPYIIIVRNALRFNIAYSKIWTDSMTAISWLRGQSKSFRSYVAYRVPLMCRQTRTLLTWSLEEELLLT